VQAWRGGEELDLGGPLQRALLASLLLNVGRVVSREQLIDALWDADPPPRAARSLETKVSRLRATLGESATVLARGGGYVLDAPADEIDVHRFERAVTEARGLLAEDPRAARSRFQDGLRVWRGEALGGLPERVLRVDRARLEDERLEALEARIDADLALGETSALVAELQVVCSEHPTRERFTEQLMLALYRSGRQAEALEAYRAAYGELRDQLGLAPGPGLRELEQAILRHDDSLGPLRARARPPRASRRRRAIGIGAITGGVLVAILLGTALGGAHRRRVPLTPGLILLDASSGKVRADVPVGDSQGITRFGYGHVWTIGDNGVMSEIDPRDGALVRSIPVGVQAGGVAVGAGGIWLTDRNGPTLLRLDPVTGQVNLRARLSTLGLRHPEPNGGIAIDAGSLWVARGPEAVDRLNPSSLKLERRIKLAQHGCEAGAGIQCDIAAAAGHVWIAGGAGDWIAQIDEATDRATVIHGLRPSLCCIAAGGGSAWVAEAHDIARLSIRGTVLHRYPVSSAAIGDVSYNDGYLWATADTTGQLLRIDARTGQVRVTHLGNLLTSTSASGGIVTASALALPAAPTRGLGPRRLQVGLEQDWLNPTDPAVARPAAGTGRWQWQLDYAICAELYTYPARHNGSTLEPELASGPARQSSDGRTWTIPIRTDVRFSPPLNRTVTAQDVRATLTRALSPQLGPGAPAAGILHEVSGLKAYREGATNDVSGIAIRRGALQITTRRPVPDLPARLSKPYFCVLPAGTPTPPGGYQDPLPTAGPYYVAEHEGGYFAVLRPNPNYKGPRDPRLDGIIYHTNVPDDTGVTEVHRGQLDYYGGETVAVNPRVSCRLHQHGIPGLDLAAVCLRSSAAEAPAGTRQPDTTVVPAR
jgi:DNA-binding SARP family transcriptional activator/streptogramin lyase